MTDPYWADLLHRCAVWLMTWISLLVPRGEFSVAGGGILALRRGVRGRRTLEPRRRLGSEKGGSESVRYSTMIICFT
eukprot:3029469-Pyramimonas_sp.AAC.1